MNIIPLSEEIVEEAAALFIEHYRRLRDQVPILPGSMANPQEVASRLEWMVSHGVGVAAVEQGQLLGYISWITNEDFRDTGQTAAYCPEWGHALQDGQAEKTFTALYREACQHWAKARCRIHAITYLANDAHLERMLYQFGFGMLVIDAVRPMQMEGTSNPAVKTRKIGSRDVEAVAAMNIEHWAHYPQPPTLMAPRQPEDAGEIRSFIESPNNNYWLAEVNGNPAGFLRFEPFGSNAARVTRSETTIAITGAYTRPDFRGIGAATALLRAALREYASRDFERCVVDFESINPEARTYWLKHFTPVCYSATRVPELYFVQP